MMFDRILNWFYRSRTDDARRSEDCDEADAERQEKRRALEQREIEARRMNDALEGIVHTIQRDRP